MDRLFPHSFFFSLWRSNGKAIKRQWGRFPLFLSLFPFSLSSYPFGGESKIIGSSPLLPPSPCVNLLVWFERIGRFSFPLLHFPPLFSGRENREGWYSFPPLSFFFFHSLYRFRPTKGDEMANTFSPFFSFSL